ncbi:MAG: glycoside hydrolase family 172 protein [Steroidobacteraceae bacterium]
MRRPGLPRRCIAAGAALLACCVATAVDRAAPAVDRAAPAIDRMLSAAQGPSAISRQLVDPAQLPAFRPVERVGFVSGYDRTGGNDDGFTGKYSFVSRIEDGLVLADLVGPGAITRMVLGDPLPEDPLEFYFDGESVPRISLSARRAFLGGHAPFTGDLAGHALGGYYSLAPIEFERSLKVVLRSREFHFYELNYLRYATGVPARSYRSGDVLRIGELPRDGQVVSATHELRPGAIITVFQTHQAGRILSLRLGPAGAFAGKDRAIVLRIHWDGASRPAVEVPVGDFFGYSFGQPATRSLLLGTEDDWNYVRLPMPFLRGARVELVDERRSGAPLHVQSELRVSAKGRQPQEGSFHAQWRRENPTVAGRSFTYLDTKGRGQLVGVTLQAQGFEPGSTEYFEGDEEAWVDGRQAFHGTGSEVAFNGGWYGLFGRWDRRQSLPLFGCLDYDITTARTGGYRFYLADAYSFEHELRLGIEHGGTGNKILTDYAGTTYFYLDSPEGPMQRLAPAASRVVIPPREFLISLASPSSVAALYLASLKPASTTIGSAWVAYAELARDLEAIPPLEVARKYFSGTDWSFATDELLAPPSANLPDFVDRFKGPPQLGLNVMAPQAGHYRIAIDALTGPRSAKLQLRVNDDPVGGVVDLYAPRRARGGERVLGTVHLDEGLNVLHLSMPGRNANSAGAVVELVSLRGTLQD